MRDMQSVEIVIRECPGLTKGVTVQAVVQSFMLSGQWGKEWGAFPGSGFHVNQNREMGNHGGTQFTELDQVLGE